MRHSGSLIRQALYLDQEDAYAAGEAVPPAVLGVGSLARALVQATLPHSDPEANGLDGALGPGSFAWGRTNDGEDRWYFYLGRAF